MCFKTVPSVLSLRKCFLPLSVFWFNLFLDIKIYSSYFSAQIIHQKMQYIYVQFLITFVQWQILIIIHQRLLLFA